MSGIDAEELSRRIAYSHPLIDKTGYDLSQLLRVPWTFNHKYDPPQMVGVHEGTTTYRPEDFDRFPRGMVKSCGSPVPHDHAATSSIFSSGASLGRSTSLPFLNRVRLS